MSDGDLTYETAERLRLRHPVNKYRWITIQCTDRNVLDLGCLDETAIDGKRGTDYWMHGRIAKMARQVLGVDSSELIPEEGILTGPTSRIVRGDVFDLHDIELPFTPDVIFAGELLEHLSDPVGFVRSLRGVERFKGARLIMTTPNASALYNSVFGMCQRECQHRDHVALQSYKTLTTVGRQAGVSSWTVFPHTTTFPELEVSTRGFARLGLHAFTASLNAAGRLFPLLSGGWLVDAQL